MNDIFLGYIISICYLILIILGGEILIRIGKNDTFKFVARKIIHILISLEWFIMYHFFKTSYHWIILCCSLFVVLLCIFPFIKSISDLNNKFSGSLLYALIATIFSLISYFNSDLFVVFGVSICALSFGDGAAGLIGHFLKKGNINLFKNKTLFGYLSALFFSFLVLIIFNNLFTLQLHIIEIIIISLMFAFIELVTPFSLDNLTTSLSTALLFYLALKTDVMLTNPISYILLPLIAALIIYKKALTLFGGVASFIISLIIILILGDGGFILLFSFFFITTICDLISKKRKEILLKNVHKRVGGRDIYQVLAVGFLPCLCAILYYFFKHELFIVMYASLLAENLADCMASEIGVLSKKRPIDICRLKPLDTGLSGGISLLGSISSIIGIIIIAIIYFINPIYINNTIIIIVTSSFLGVVMDSVFGSLLQRKNICPICNSITEKDQHCNTNTKHYKGVKWIDNSMVNLMSNFITIMFSMIFFFII